MRLRYASVLAVLLCFAATLRADGPTPPDTPQGRRVQALLKAFAAGTPEALRAFVGENFAPGALKETPIEQRVQRLSAMAKETGPLDFQKMLESKPAEASFLARSKKNGDWLEVGMMLDPAAGNGIRGLRLEQVDGPDVHREGRKGSDAEVAAAADAHLRKLEAAGEFSGVALLAKNGTPFFHKAYGMADRAFGVANRPDTKFNLGSINKTFTQTAIAQLAEKGKLSLSDTIRKHLADYPLAAADRITIQQLVTMSSGLGDFFGEKFDATPKSRIRTLADYLRLFATDPLLFEPGSSRRYSNAGYVVLGLIIEKVTGQTYYDYVRENIYGPAGMTSSDSYMQDAIVPNRAVGYTSENASGKPLPEPRVNVYELPARGSSAGGGYSTAEDMLRFDLAMRGGKLLSPAWAAWYYSDQSVAPAGVPGELHGGKGVAGGTAGVNAVLEMDLDTGYTVVVLSNIDPPSAERVAKTFRQWLGLN
jgi:CubicO group peptidase (beta-lactamase class C family)